MVAPSDFAPFNLGDILGNIQRMKYMQAESDARRQDMADKRAEREALASVFSGGTVDTPSGVPGRPDQAKLGALMRVNPEMGMQVQKYFDGLGEDQRKQEADKWKAAGPLLLQMGQMPYEQRRQFMQSAAPALVANGWKPEEIASFDPTDENVKALSSTAMSVDQVIGANTMKWNPIGENGSFATDQFGNPVGSGNPFAPGAQQAPQAAPQGGNGAVNNNPGALRVPGSMKFQSFATPQQGIAAQGALLNRYMGRGLNSVSSIVETYAPRKSRGGDNSDASVNNYIGYVSRQLGVDPNAPLPTSAIPRLAKAMREFETGNRANPHNADAIRQKAQAAIAAGADPAAVRQRAAALGVTL